MLGMVVDAGSLRQFHAKKNRQEAAAEIPSPCSPASGSSGADSDCRGPGIH